MAWIFHPRSTIDSMQMRIENKRGFEVDMLDFTFRSRRFAANPKQRCSLQAWIGWQHSGLVYKGSYIVKEVEHAGAPDVLRIRATSADMKKSLKQKKERSFDNIALGDLIRLIALEHDLNDSVAADLASHKIIHIDQNESDANLITRLADEHDAIATIKMVPYFFMPKGQSQTISGQDLPTYKLTRAMVMIIAIATAMAVKKSLQFAHFTTMIKWLKSSKSLLGISRTRTSKSYVIFIETNKPRH
jgi:phage protein D